MAVRAYETRDLPAMIRIWNQVVEEGISFPQAEFLDEKTGAEFFASQSCCGVAQEDDCPGTAGLYILHPNNVGRCGHIANASYAVDKAARGRHIGETLVADSLLQAKRLGFRILQFNAVVKTNAPARHLYEKLGFVPLGVIPGGFLMKDGHFEDICPYYHLL
jgi:L-amino acid N-acyltransferase YncA